MSENLGYEELRVDAVRQVAKLMAASAITAPTSGGQLFLAGPPRLIARGHLANGAHTLAVSPTTHRLYVPLANAHGHPVLAIYQPA